MESENVVVSTYSKGCDWFVFYTKDTYAECGEVTENNFYCWVCTFETDGTYVYNCNEVKQVNNLTFDKLVKVLSQVFNETEEEVRKELN